jgi:hypothetical protein
MKNARKRSTASILKFFKKAMISRIRAALGAAGEWQSIKANWRIITELKNQFCPTGFASN